MTPRRRLIGASVRPTRARPWNVCTRHNQCGEPLERTTAYVSQQRIDRSRLENHMVAGKRAEIMRGGGWVQQCCLEHAHKCAWEFQALLIRLPSLAGYTTLSIGQQASAGARPVVVCPSAEISHACAIPIVRRY